MESPVRKMQKRNDYNRHKLFRKIKRRRKTELELLSKAAEKELKKRLKLKMPKYEDGKDDYLLNKNESDKNLDLYKESVEYIQDYVKSEGFKQRWQKQFPKQDLSIVTQDMLDKTSPRTYTEDESGNIVMVPESKLITQGLLIGETLGGFGYNDYSKMINYAGRNAANAEALANLLEDGPFGNYNKAEINNKIDKDTAIKRGPWYNESYLDSTININNNIDYQKIAKDKFGEDYSRYINPYHTGAHEAAHQFRYKNIPELWNRILMPELYVPTINDKHDSKSDERQADQKASRFLNYKGIGFDSRIPNLTYTKEHLDSYKKYLKEKNIKDRFLDLVGDDLFIDGMNIIAYNDKTNKKLMYANKGKDFNTPRFTFIQPIFNRNK